VKCNNGEIAESYEEIPHFYTNTRLLPDLAEEDSSKGGTRYGLIVDDETLYSVYLP
jgi:hypothetical protein